MSSPPLPVNPRARLHVKGKQDVTTLLRLFDALVTNPTAATAVGCAPPPSPPALRSVVWAPTPLVSPLLLGRVKCHEKQHAKVASGERMPYP